MRSRSAATAIFDRLRHHSQYGPAGGWPDQRAMGTAPTEKGKHMKVKTKIRVSRMICGY
jgi:hypothetical protein